MLNCPGVRGGLIFSGVEASTNQGPFRLFFAYAFEYWTIGVPAREYISKHGQTLSLRH